MLGASTCVYMTSASPAREPRCGSPAADAIGDSKGYSDTTSSSLSWVLPYQSSRGSAPQSVPSVALRVAGWLLKDGGLMHGLGCWQSLLTQPGSTCVQEAGAEIYGILHGPLMLLIVATECCALSMGPLPTRVCRSAMFAKILP